MKTNIMLKCLCMLAMMAMSAGNADAQNLKSMLGGLVKNVIGDKTTTGSSIIGTWAYVGPECQFESDNLLSKAGGEVASQKVEEKMQSVYQKVGMENSKYTFNEDSTYTCTIKDKTSNGTYTFDSETKTITMKSRLGIKTVAYVTVTGNTMNIVFKADKLMAALKAITGTTANTGTTASVINSIAGSYDGLRLGFELKKQE